MRSILIFIAFIYIHPAIGQNPSEGYFSKNIRIKFDVFNFIIAQPNFIYENNFKKTFSTEVKIGYQFPFFGGLIHDTHSNLWFLHGPTVNAGLKYYPNFRKITSKYYFQLLSEYRHRRWDDVEVCLYASCGSSYATFERYSGTYESIHLRIHTGIEKLSDRNIHEFYAGLGIQYRKNFEHVKWRDSPSYYLPSGDVDEKKTDKFPAFSVSLGYKWGFILHRKK